MQSVTFPKSPRFAFFQSSVMRNTLYIQLCAWYILAFMLGRYIIHNIVLNAKLAQQIHCDRTLGLCSQAFKKLVPQLQSCILHICAKCGNINFNVLLLFLAHNSAKCYLYVLIKDRDCECCFQFAVVILR